MPDRAVGLLDGAQRHDQCVNEFLEVIIRTVDTQIPCAKSPTGRCARGKADYLPLGLVLIQSTLHCSRRAAILRGRCRFPLLRFRLRGSQRGLLQKPNLRCPHGHGNGHGLFQLVFCRSKVPCNCKAITRSRVASCSERGRKRNQMLCFTVDGTFSVRRIEKLVVLSEQIRR